MIEHRAGDDRALVSARDGGRLASLHAGGAQRLRRHRTAGGDATRSIDWGCYLMTPWVGRLDHGTLPTSHGTFTMPANFGPHAIHGTTFDEPWDVVAVTPALAILERRLVDPWPLGGVARQAIRLRDGRLDLVAEVEAGDHGMPAALGWHPWFVVDDEERTFVTLAASATLGVSGDLLPTGELDPLTSVTGLAADRALGQRRLDHTYTGVGTSATVSTPDLAMRLRWYGPIRAVTVHSPAGYLCVEPLTAWPNAVQLAEAGVGGTGLVELGPHERLRAGFRIEWAPSGGARAAAASAARR